jgi:DNA replication protein DnaC
MREIGAELKAMKLYGMASAWAELCANGNDVGLQGSRWLIERLLEAETTDRAMRSIRYQMSSARFPIHRDLAGFNFEQSCVDRKLISELSDLSFTDDAHNVVLVGGPDHAT